MLISFQSAEKKRGDLRSPRITGGKIFPFTKNDTFILLSILENTVMQITKKYICFLS